MHNDLTSDISFRSEEAPAKSESSLKKDYFWNTLGSVMSALSSVILLFLTTRIVGEYWAGVFSIAYAIGQQFQTLGAFEMRPMQSTDVDKRYNFATYFASRVLTTTAMLFCIIGYALVTTSKQEEVLIVILIASLKLFDVFEDVFHGAFQQHGRLDIAGRAFFFRSAITTFGFIAVLAITQDLFVSCLVAIAMSIIALLALNVPYAKKLVLPSGKLVLKAMFRLLGECLPLFVGAFLATYLVNAPKFGLDAAMTKEYQTYFAAIFMPALVINLLSAFVFRPLLTRLAQFWTNRDMPNFIGIITKGLVWVTIASIIVAVLSFFLGIPVLNLLMGIDLSDYKVELMVLVVGGAFNAANIVVYYGLVVMRRQVFVLIGYAIAAVFAFIFSSVMINEWGMVGASFVYSASMLIVFILFSAFFLVQYNKKKER